MEVSPESKLVAVLQLKIQKSYWGVSIHSLVRKQHVNHIGTVSLEYLTCVLIRYLWIWAFVCFLISLVIWDYVRLLYAFLCLLGFVYCFLPLALIQWVS